MLLAVLVVMVPIGWSYGSYLRAPGDAPLSVRSVEFLRDHGFESLINDVEQWWYTRKKPIGARPPAADVVSALRRAAPLGVATTPPSGQRVSRSAGAWVDVSGLSSAPGSVQQTYVLPDPKEPSVAANVVRFDQHTTSLVLVPGTVEPGGNAWAWKSEIPLNQRSHAIAAFNAGFRFRHTPGGVYAEGRHAVRPLENGLASMVIRSDGTADVADWGRDATLTSDVVSVRQNLALIVDHGRAASGLEADRGGRWGTTRSQFQYTWRSGVGVDALGRLVYAAGAQMTLTQLAAALVDAGAVRAMQLDIHDGVVTFNWYRPTSGNKVSASKLFPAMQRSATRYLAPDQRDFFTVMSPLDDAGPEPPAVTWTPP